MKAQEFIKKSRKVLGLTQKELAHMLLVAPISIYRWEKGMRKPSKQSIKILKLILKNTEE